MNFRQPATLARVAWTAEAGQRLRRDTGIRYRGIAGWLLTRLTRDASVERSVQEVDLKKYAPPGGVSPAIGRGLVGVVAALVFGIVTMAAMIEVIEAGHVGVVLTWGKAEREVRHPGLQVIVPFMQSIVHIDTRVQPHEFTEIDAASEEYQSVKITGKLNYHIDPARAGELYQAVGTDFATKVIDPALADLVKEVVPGYSVTEILPRRDEIRREVKQRMTDNLDRYGIVIDDIYFANISFSPEYQAAIERKQTAEQNALAEQQILKQKEWQAQQAEVEAKGKANAYLAQQRAEADAILYRSQKQAEANEALNRSLSPQLLEYRRLEKWDGRQPMVVGSSSSDLLIQVPNPQPTPPPQ